MSMTMAQHREVIQKLVTNITSVYQGRDQIVKFCLVALLSRGHLLLEDVPGVGKTTLASVLAKSIDCDFQRIQFTSDLLPSDILGVTIYNQASHLFEFKPGPIFSNVILGDEINRTTPKTQSALLEAMSTGQVSLDGTTHILPEPFIVLATQNPAEFHGTFPLPKSQMDRFVMRLHLGYPDHAGELQVLRTQGLAMKDTAVKPVVTRAEVMELQQAAGAVLVEDSLLDYIIRLGQATRDHAMAELGVSTRGLLALRRCAQALALIEGRNYVIPEDIRQLAPPVFAHRIQLARTFDTNSYHRHEDEELVREILQEVAVPV
ncbi:MAG: MoxR family ATPase [Candidatus Sumerlaeia bacterium]|nr:MoxR family ATPase [Candidatus Sumerlaeia bacterium]